MGVFMIGDDIRGTPVDKEKRKQSGGKRGAQTRAWSRAPQARCPAPFPAGERPFRKFRIAVAMEGKKGLPANRQPLHKGACGLTKRHQKP